MPWRQLLARLGRGVYWTLLVPLLLFFPILQLRDALPEGRFWSLAAYAALLIGLGVPIATRRRRLLHSTIVLGFLGAGVILFLLNQGILREPARAADVQILRRTSELLVDEASWDRSPSRDCLEGTKDLTLYCALRQASFEVTGGFRHRAPALQAVRSQIEVLRPRAGYEHRLADFNSDPGVELEDVHELLTASAAQLTARAEGD